MTDRLEFVWRDGTTHSTPPPDPLLMDWTRGDLIAEVERLHSWDGLMSLLDEHYPADVFDGSSGDIGPTIVVLIRQINELRRTA